MQLDPTTELARKIAGNLDYYEGWILPDPADIRSVTFQPETDDAVGSVTWEISGAEPETWTIPGAETLDDVREVIERIERNLP